MTISDIPFQGPVGAVRVGYIDGAFVVNPTSTEMENSTLDLRLAGTADAILMVECGANEIPEALMVEALDFAHKSLQPMIELQNQMRAQLGKPKSTAYPKFAVAPEKGRRGAREDGRAAWPPSSKKAARKRTSMMRSTNWKRRS